MYSPSPSDNTSALALHQLGNDGRKTMADTIFDIALAMQRRGARDMSRKEIQRAYEDTFGKRIEGSTISARVNELIVSGRLEVVVVKRPCQINPSSEISPVRVPQTQMRLTA